MEMGPQRLGTVVSAADGNAVAVQDGGRIVGMDPVDGKGDDPGLFFGIRAPQDMDMGHLQHPFQAPVGQFPFVFLHLVHADVV